jgi:hypothetical protein
MTGDVQSLDAWRARHSGADAETVSRRVGVANVYCTHAEEALALLAGAADSATRDALRRITESWLELATAELSALPAHA